MTLSRNRIFLAGHNGLVGSAIFRNLIGRGVRPITRERRDLDLGDASAVGSFLESERIDTVVMAAAKVGGIYANATYPAEFISQNLQMQNAVIDQAWRHGVGKLLFLGSSCIYPKVSPQPIPEAALMTGPLEPTNEPYAIAKIAGIKMCEAYNRQYGVDYRSAMPTNLYGPGDNFHPDNSHVLPALMRRFHEAMEVNAESVTVWGSGQPRREFLHVDDMADACVFLLNLPRADYDRHVTPSQSHVNVGCGEDISIAELSTMIAKVVGFRGRIDYDRSKSDGTMCKRLDVTRLTNMGWQASIPLFAGIEATYRWFIEHRHSVRNV